MKGLSSKGIALGVDVIGPKTLQAGAVKGLITSLHVAKHLDFLPPLMSVCGESNILNFLLQEFPALSS